MQVYRSTVARALVRLQNHFLTLVFRAPIRKVLRHLRCFRSLKLRACLGFANNRQMLRPPSGQSRTSSSLSCLLSKKGFWTLKRTGKLLRSTRIRTNSLKARTASIPAPLGFRKPQDHPPLENCHADRRASTYCRESAYRQLHFWDRNQNLLDVKLSAAIRTGSGTSAEEADMRLLH